MSWFDGPPCPIPLSPFSFHSIPDPDSHPIPRDLNCHSISDRTICTPCPPLRVGTSEYHPHPPPPLPAPPRCASPASRPPSLRASARSSTPLLLCTPSPLIPKSQGPHPQRIRAPLFSRHFCHDHAGADLPYFLSGQLLAVRQPKAQAPARNPPTALPLWELTQVGLLTLSRRPPAPGPSLPAQWDQLQAPSSLLCWNSPCAVWLLCPSHSLPLHFLFFLYLSKSGSSPFKV